MPPRKRARVSQATSPTPTSQPKTPTPAESSSSKPDEQLLNDPWTDDEEIALFKSLIRWKPTGIHKHFHLLALHQHLLEGGHIHPRNEHTKPAGIWRKLQSLYNLDALVEREDARQLEKIQIPPEFRREKTDSEEEEEDTSTSTSGDADVYSEAANKMENEEFNLPGEEFEGRKWAHRLATTRQRREDSPPVLPELNMADEPPVRFTPSFSIEPSEAATPTSRRGRPRGTTSATRGRPATSAMAASTRKSTRKAGSAATEEIEPQVEDADEGEEEGGDESEEENEESEASTPARRGTRSAKSGPARTNTRTRARRR